MAELKTLSLLELAREDLVTSGLSGIPSRISAYHISQAIEKAARALCIEEGIEVGNTHQIWRIADLLPDSHPLKADAKQLDYHSTASSKYRYPDAGGRVPREPTAADIKKRLYEATDFIQLVENHLGLNSLHALKP